MKRQQVYIFKGITGSSANVTTDNVVLLVPAQETSTSGGVTEQQLDDSAASTLSAAQAHADGAVAGLAQTVQLIGGVVVGIQESLANYLLKSGGTITGDITIDTAEGSRMLKHNSDHKGVKFIKDGGVSTGNGVNSPVEDGQIIGRVTNTDTSVKHEVANGTTSAVIETTADKGLTSTKDHSAAYDLKSYIQKAWAQANFKQRPFLYYPGYTANFSVDFDTVDGFGRKVGTTVIPLTGPLTFTAATNKGEAKEMEVIIIGDSNPRTLTFPSAWRWTTPKPTTMPADKIGVLYLFSLDTTEANIIASYVVQI